MKARGINVACLMAGIVIAVITMNLLPGKETELVEDVALPQEKAELQSAPQASVQESTRKEVVPALIEIVDLEEPSSDLKADQYRELLNRVFSGEASEDEQLAFWEEIRTSPEIGKIIAEQERKTPKDSGDVQGHMNLAELYVAKLVSASPGPERGIWAGKAEQRWRAVLEIDPNHWDAQHSVALTLSMYPDFLNKTGTAINEYEKLVAIQSDLSPEPRHAQTYLELYRLYQKVGDPAHALEVLEEGLSRFPKNKHLFDQRNSVSTLSLIANKASE